MGAANPTAANPHKGEVSFELVSGETFILAFDIDAICVLEDMLDLPLQDITPTIARGRFGHIRAAMWAGLRRHHPKIMIVEVGEMMIRIKGKRKAVDLVVEALKKAIGQKEEGAADEGAEDPPPPPVGTGPAS